MSRNIWRTFKILIKTIAERGIKYTWIAVCKRSVSTETSPLARCPADVMFALNTEDVRAGEKKKKRHDLGGMFSDSSNLEASYPLVFEQDGKFLRYAYSKAVGKPKGLVVTFHGWGGEFSSGLRPKGWEDFNVLSPWDTFGHNRRGSWFWGEKGDDFVEKLVQALIKQYANQMSEEEGLFCYGGSMGGFGALLHGILLQADGMYIQMPQVDLFRKVVEYGEGNFDNPYGFLLGNIDGKRPDLLELANRQSVLPPLFLVQNQYDAVNPFHEHGFKLLEVYNRKRCWYGVRVYPAIGHSNDGGPEEASYFFKLILEKGCPKVFSA